MAHAHEPGLAIRQGQPGDDGAEQQAALRTDWWSVEPGICRVVDESPQRVDRLRCLGNGVVPQCAEEAFGRLMGIEGMEALRG